MTMKTNNTNDPNFQVFTDCSGDACPPDDRYEEYCMKALCKFLKISTPKSGIGPESIADEMASLAALDRQPVGWLHRESSVKEAKRAWSI